MALRKGLSFTSIFALGIMIGTLASRHANAKAESRNFWYDRPEVLKLECQNLLKGNVAPKLYTREELMKKKAELLPDLQDWATRFYYERGTRAFAELKRLNVKFTPLIVDPGIVFRIDEFIAFAEKQRHTDTDPWVLRNQFSESLGKTVVYRAIAVTNKDSGAIKNFGMQSRLVRDTGFLHEFYYFEDEQPLSRATVLSLSQQMSMRIDGNENAYWRPRTSLLSISADPEIAKAVAFDHLQKDQRVFLAKILIPILDLISPSEVFRSSQSDSIKKWIDTTFLIHPVGEPQRKIVGIDEIESFISYVVQPEEVISFIPLPKSKIGYVGEVDPKTNEILNCYGNCPEALIKKLARDKGLFKPQR